MKKVICENPPSKNIKVIGTNVSKPVEIYDRNTSQVLIDIKTYAESLGILPTREPEIPNFLRFNMGTEVRYMAINDAAVTFNSRETDIIVGINNVIPVHVVKSFETGKGIVDHLNETYPNATLDRLT